MKSALIKLHLAVFLWGFTGVLGRTIQLNEGLLVWYRISITVVSLFALLWFKKQLQAISPKQMLQLSGVGLIIALHWVCFYGSIKYANVSIALICLASAGVMTAILEPLFNRTAIKLSEVALGLIGLLGIFLVFHFDTRYRTGIIVGVIATALSVVFSLFNKRLVSNIASQTVMAYELAGGLMGLTALMPIYLHYFPTTQLLPNKADWGWLLLLSWVCTILAMDFSLQALKKVSAFTQNLTLNLEPVYGIILAFILYHENENLSSSFYWGFGIILCTVILQMLRIIKLKRH